MVKESNSTKEEDNVNEITIQEEKSLEDVEDVSGTIANKKDASQQSDKFDEKEGDDIVIEKLDNEDNEDNEDNDSDDDGNVSFADFGKEETEDSHKIGEESEVINNVSTDENKKEENMVELEDEKLANQNDKNLESAELKEEKKEDTETKPAKGSEEINMEDYLNSEVKHGPEFEEEEKTVSKAKMEKFNEEGDEDEDYIVKSSSITKKPIQTNDNKIETQVKKKTTEYDNEELQKVVNESLGNVGRVKNNEQKKSSQETNEKDEDEKLDIKSRIEELKKAVQGEE